MPIHSRETPWGDGNLISSHWRSCNIFTGWRPEARIWASKKSRCRCWCRCQNHLSDSVQVIVLPPSMMYLWLLRELRKPGALQGHDCWLPFVRFTSKHFYQRHLIRSYGLYNSRLSVRVVYLRPPTSTWFSVLPSLEVRGPKFPHSDSWPGQVMPSKKW